jgi:uncharacterized membrane protein
MATLTVWKFDDPDAADEAVRVLDDLQKQGLIHVLDATWISWRRTHTRSRRYCLPLDWP